MRNVTLAMEEQLIERGREYARRRGMSFNALIREQLYKLVYQQSDWFLDTNVLVYASDRDEPEKRRRARALLRATAADRFGCRRWSQALRACPAPAVTWLPTP